MYLDMLDDDTKCLKRYIWKMKVPLKIKVFMWFLHRKVILTKDNLVKKNGMVKNHVVSAIIRNLFNTYVLIAHLRR
jgi:hypothetical protein